MTSVSSQRGSALIISLVILTAIILGAIVAMQRSTLQVRMVGNMQHQQKVFNAAYSDLSGLMDEFRSSNNSTLTTILNDAIVAYNADNTATINPYATGYGLTKPNSPDNVKAVTNSLRSFEPPTSSSSASLKEMEGSSTGTLVPFYFASTAVAADTHDSVTSTQQIGLYYLAPAPQ